MGREEEEAIDPLLDVDGPSTDEPGAPKEMVNMPMRYSKFTDTFL